MEIYVLGVKALQSAESMETTNLTSEDNGNPKIRKNKPTIKTAHLELFKTETIGSNVKLNICKIS